MSKHPSFCLEVFGDFACFTRPEMKVERVSYDVITPSAARAIFEAILWKPGIRWQIDRIEVLKPLRWTNIRRNEVKKKYSYSKTLAQSGGLGNEGMEVEDDRVQRAALLLRDVKYRLHAHMEFTRNEDANAGKYLGMFTRRAEKGQCINQPYLGCREFACSFRLVDPDSEPATPIKETRDLGFMLYDLDFARKGGPAPLLFRAQLTNGVIDVPHIQSKEVIG